MRVFLAVLFAAGTAFASATQIDVGVRTPSLVEYLPVVDAAFVGKVEIGGVNRAVLTVEKNLGCPLPAIVLVEGFNTVDVNSAHYRLRQDDRRLVLGYSLPDEKGRARVLVPSPYSGCFPVEGDRVTVTFYEGGAPVSCDLHLVVEIISIALKKDRVLVKRLAEVLGSPRLEDRYVALALASVARDAAILKKVREFLEDDNPVMREAAALSLTAAADAPLDVPSPGVLDGGGVAVTLRALTRRLERVYGIEMAGWTSVASAYAGRALDLMTRDKTLSAEMAAELDGAVNEVLGFLKAAAPFSTEGAATLLAYPGKRAAVLAVLGASGDWKVLPLVARYLGDRDSNVADAAAVAVRMITGDMTITSKHELAPFLSSGAAAAKERLRRIVMARNAASEGGFGEAGARIALFCGNRALFYIGPITLVKGGELNGYDEFPWTEMAYPAALPHLAIGGLATDELSVASVLQGLALLTRRYAAAEAWLSFWGLLYGRYGTLLQRYYALKALRDAPCLGPEEKAVVLAGLAADEYDIRLAAARCAVRHGLPLLDYRPSEEPGQPGSRLDVLAKLWSTKVGTAPVFSVPPNSEKRLPSPLYSGTSAESTALSLEALWDEGGEPMLEDAYSQAKNAYVMLASRDKDGLRRLAGKKDVVKEVRLAAIIGLATLSLRERAAGEEPLEVGKTGPTERTLLLLGRLASPGEKEFGMAERAAFLAFGDRVQSSDFGSDAAVFRLAGLLAAGQACPVEQRTAVLKKALENMSSGGVSAAVEVALMPDGPDGKFWVETLVSAKNSAARRVAARVLARSAAEVPAAAVRKALGAGDASVVYEVCRMVEARKISGARDALLGVVSGGDTLLTYAALRALAAAGEPFTDKVARAVGPIDDYTAHCVEPLVAMGGAEAKRLAEEQIKGTLWRARYFAVLGLAGSRERWAKEMLVDLWLDERERLSVTAEAGMMSGTPDLPRLMLSVLRERAAISTASGRGLEMALLIAGVAEKAGMTLNEALGPLGDRLRQDASARRLIEFLAGSEKNAK